MENKSKYALIFFMIIFVSSCNTFNNDCLEKKDKQNIILKKEYHKNGQLKEVGALIDSVMQGYWIGYDSLGRKNSECIYLDNELNGPFILYYENGNKMIEGYMVNNAWEGERIWYFWNGNIQDKGAFNNVGKDGIWEYYTEDGMLDKKVLYKDGDIVEVLEDNYLDFPPWIPQ